LFILLYRFIDFDVFGRGFTRARFVVLSLSYINTFKPLNAFIALNPYLWARVGVERWIAV